MIIHLPLSYSAQACATPNRGSGWENHLNDLSSISRTINDFIDNESFFVGYCTVDKGYAEPV